MDTRTDSDLMAAYAKACDENAFAELVARHQRMVYRVCLRMLRHHQEAEDAAQAVFLVLLSKASRLTRKGELTGWLYGVARNVCLEALRTRARRQEEAMLDENEVPAAEECRPDHEEVMPFLDEELAGLSGVLRQAVVLRYLQGYGQADAAQQAGCSEVTLSVRASRGIERLRQRLAKRGIALSGVALAGLLTSEASAAVPETLLPSILAVVKTAAATGATATTATSTAAMLAKGAMKAMFIAKVKSVAAVVAAVIVTGTVVPVGIAVAQVAKAGISHTAVKDEDAASTQKVVRFIRLKYDGPGWDDGMDEKSGADRNFLERYGQLTGFKVSKNGEAHPIKLLANPRVRPCSQRARKDGEPLT
jgi:RNA polymerase sigma factor (sigma-70 family)